jgi:hypothetical protein
LLGETEYLRQAEPGAWPTCLVVKNGLEDAAELICGNADAGIRDGDGDIAVGILRMTAERRQARDSAPRSSAVHRRPWRRAR